MSKDIYNVFPTSSEKNKLKIKKQMYQKAFTNIKFQVFALETHCQEVGNNLIAHKNYLHAIFKETGLLMVQVRNMIGDFNSTVLNSVTEPRIKVACTKKIHFGVQTTSFHPRIEGNDQFHLLGLAKGGLKVKLLKQSYMHAIEALVELATLQNTFEKITAMIKRHRRKVNALEHFLIPKLERTIKHIDNEIDERERDDNYRLKLFKHLKEERKKEKEREEQMERENKNAKEVEEDGDVKKQGVDDKKNKGEKKKIVVRN